MADKAKISFAPNGPIMVENLDTLENSNGTKVRPKTKIALCRCGKSANKPFCDGTHGKIGFESEPDRSNIRNTPIEYKGTVEGVEMTISYTPVLCTHAGECQKRALEVFNPRKQPWIQPEQGTVKSIMDVMGACPSGALSISFTEDPPRHMVGVEEGIRVQRNGPYFVSNIETDADFNGANASKGKYALCRCGLSNNKPFCDGRHFEEKWRERETAE